MSRTALIVKLAAIGDVVMALPMVTALRAQHADVHVAWMCGRTVAPLLERVDGIDELFVIDERGLLVGSPAAKFRAGLAAWRLVAGRRFDEVCIAHSDPRYRWLVWPVVAGRRRWLGGGEGERALVPGRTHADEYVRLVTGVDDYRAASFPAPPLRVRLPDTIAAQLTAHNPDERPLIALAPGGARNVARENPLRRWPLERYVELARALEAQGYRSIVVGDTLDGWVRTAFGATDALDLVGQTDLPSLVALFQQCAAVVAHDSGPLHLARLAAVPVVALLGPTPPTMLFRPDARTVTLWPAASLPCAPCYDGHDFADCPDNRCMQLIGCHDVLSRIRALAPQPALDAAR